MQIGIDYSFSEPNFKDVKAKGYSFALSYFSKDQSKDWGKDELKRCLDAGLQAGAVYELGAKGPLSGFGAGVNDAADAVRQANEIAYSGVLYFAVDFRPNAAQMEAVKAYFRGINTVLGTWCGVYGAYETIEAVKDSVQYGWQVSTWTINKKIHPLAAIVQDANANHTAYPKLSGVDYNYSTRDNMGLMGGTPPTPPQKDQVRTMTRTQEIKTRIGLDKDGYGDFFRPTNLGPGAHIVNVVPALSNPARDVIGNLNFVGAGDDGKGGVSWQMRGGKADASFDVYIYVENE